MTSKPSSGAISAMKSRSSSPSAPIPETGSSTVQTKVAEAIKATDLQEHTGKLITNTASTDLLCIFLLFPKLPKTIRLDIFELALPYSRGDVLRVWIDNFPDDEWHPWMTTYEDFTFSVMGCQSKFGGNHALWTNFGLSRACKESRSVFLKHTTGRLPGADGNIIRFDDDMIVHIANFEGLVFWDAFVADVSRRGGPRMLKCLRTIKRLSVPLMLLTDDYCRDEGYPNGAYPILAPFKNLKELFGRFYGHEGIHWWEDIYTKDGLVRLEQKLKNRKNKAKVALINDYAEIMNL